jgi:REP element-mobilizing transposase RayT
MSEQRVRTHGGKRAGAGRKKSGKKLGGPHRARPAMSSRHPQHVTLRTVARFPRLRQRRYYEALRRVLARYLEGEGFRVVHVSMQQNHLHLIVEAEGRRALWRGMQSFAIRAARAFNATRRGHGKVFAYRYHASQIRDDRYAHNALSYVLNNWRRHQADVYGECKGAKLDPYSSAVSFGGWTERFETPAWYDPLPVSAARTRLMTDGWTTYGLLRHDIRPGPLG